jgi:peptidoglycan/LPS O-acetylase OafA/YrhL
MNGRNLLDFYRRRIQRIVPIHCVFLVLTFITAQCLLLPADLALIRSEFLISLGFAINYEGMILGPGLVSNSEIFGEKVF